MGLIFPKRLYFKPFPIEFAINVIRRKWRLAWRECWLLWQRRRYGWDDSDTYSLDYTIALFVLPRLKRFKEMNNGVPNIFCSQGADAGDKIWQLKLDMMINAMELVIKNGKTGILSIEENVKMEEGLYVFGEYFIDLWW